MNNIPAAAPLNPQVAMPYNPARKALETCILPRVLNGEESLDNGVNLFKVCYNTAARQQLITAITTNDFPPKVIDHIEEFLTSDEGLIGELKNQYQPPHNAQLSHNHHALLAWALHQQAPNQPNAHQAQHTLRQLWEQLATVTVLTEAMYLQLDALSGAAHHPGQGLVNPNLPIRVALARNLQTPIQLLTRLSEPPEHPRVRLAAIENGSTPGAAVERCLQEDENLPVLLAAARRAFPRRNADSPPTEGEAQLRARGIDNLNRRLDLALIIGNTAARRLF